MATGIVSLALYQQSAEVLSAVLLVVAVAAYAVLLVLFAVRIVRFPRAVAADLSDSRFSFGFFTVVAGSNVLSVRLALAGIVTPAVVLAVTGLVSWLVLGYLVPWMTFLGPRSGSQLETANGTWFIWSVASQSVAVAAGTLEFAVSGGALLGIVAVFFWSVGIVLYGAAAIFLSLRVIVHGLRPEQFDPPYWVCMGAMAIAVVAGTRIVGMESTPMVDAIRTLASGTTVVFWCFAAWLIPALVAGGIWRHGVKRVPLRYEPGMWSIIFPLGMFAVASTNLGRVDALPLVARVGELWVWVALPAWLAVAAALTWSLARPHVRSG